MTYIRKFIKDLESIRDGLEVTPPQREGEAQALIAKMLKEEYSLDIDPSSINLVSVGPLVNCDLNADGTVTVTVHFEYDNYEQETETERDQG